MASSSAAARGERSDGHDVAPVRADRIRQLGGEDAQADIVVGRELLERTGQCGLRERHLGRTLALGEIAHRVGDVEHEEHSRAPAIGLPMGERALDLDR